MDNPNPPTNPTEFGSYANYLAARVDGLRTAWGMSRTGAVCRVAKTEEGDDGRKVSGYIGKAEHFVNPSAGTLRGLQMSPRGGDDTWKEMCDMAVFTASKMGAGAHGLTPKLRPPKPEQPSASS